MRIFVIQLQPKKTINLFLTEYQHFLIYVSKKVKKVFKYGVYSGPNTGKY